MVRAMSLLLRRSFRAMNTDISVISTDATRGRAAAAAESMFAAIESRFSRFRPSSELCRLNALAGTTIEVSAEMLDLLLLAQHYCRITGGVFEPAVLPSLRAAGYDRSFEAIADMPTAVAPPPSAPRGSILDVVLDAAAMTACLPEGVQIDVGGIGKGYAVDRARELFEPGAGLVIDAGGDIYAGGDSADCRGWWVAVAGPGDEDADLDVVNIRNEAIATSSVLKRRWKRGEHSAHHLIDPRTGAPAAGEIVSVSVIAPSASEADVYAKTALILGREEGTLFLESRALAGLFVFKDSSIEVTAAWPEHRRN